jgi:hypothetical protein
MQQRKMNKSAFSVLALCVSALALPLTNAAGQNNQTNDKVRVLSPGIELAEVLSTADQCASRTDDRGDQNPITKFMLMRQEVLTHGPNHKE